MEVLSCLLSIAVEGGYLFGCGIRGRRDEGLVILNLLYADDSLLFYEANCDQMAYLSWLLMWFEAIVGLRINLNKSELIPLGRIFTVEALVLS